MRSRYSSAVVTAASVSATALALHSAVNAWLLRTPPDDPPPTDLAVTVLLPLRNEALRVEECLRSVLAQVGVENLDVVVLDDASTDGTAEAVGRVSADDPRVRLMRSDTEPPQGWLGKTYACQRLAEGVDGSQDILVFLDADVVLAPNAIAATVALMEQTSLDLVSPYPRQVALSPSERLVQPLLQWSWLTFLPVRLAERSPRPSLSAANGQLLAVREQAYLRAGGHAAVRGEVIEDVALLRRVKTTGGRGGVVDGTSIATCHMYDDWTQLREGYAKSLWSAFGSPTGAATAVGLLAWLYLLPPAAAMTGSQAGALGYGAAVAGRVVTARRTGARAWPDSLAHPAGIALLCGLTSASLVRRRRGTLNWRGRALP